ncbi:sugar phosphate isomerase/epimerase family protein [Micromonospora sp. NPDC006766]|uniref:sugar phosphate isomerase/epimerase family protein n=1 Tax=Micromonospora sp. NPDC006766 TaxID=3154778 RepID=UPI0033FB54E2
MTEWTLSGFGDEIDPEPAVQLAVLSALGAKHIEVRSAWGTNIVEMSDVQLHTLSDAIAERGMAVSAIASPVGKADVTSDDGGELARLRAAVSAARRLGSRYIRIFSFYRPAGMAAAEIRDAVLARMRAFAALAEDSGVVLLHENEKNIYGDVPERIIDILETVDSPALRVAWDSANFVQVGVRPYDDGYALLRPHIDYLQVKDALMTTGEVVPAGDGDGQLRQTLTALRDDGYAGFASLEPHLFIQHGLSGPAQFGRAARAFAQLTTSIGVDLQ